jgi:hypothetical protein
MRNTIRISWAEAWDIDFDFSLPLCAFAVKIITDYELGLSFVHDSYAKAVCVLYNFAVDIILTASSASHSPAIHPSPTPPDKRRWPMQLCSN